MNRQMGTVLRKAFYIYFIKYFCRSLAVQFFDEFLLISIQRLPSSKLPAMMAKLLRLTALDWFVR